MLQKPGVRFVCLQKGYGNERTRDELGGRYPIEDFGDDVGGIPASRPCATPRPSMMNLDLIVTLDSALAHLAGALNRLHVRLLPRKRPNRRWLLGREDSPWYPSARSLSDKRTAASGARSSSGWQSN